MPTFFNGRSLRDYQLASLQWMVANWSEGRNCILGDEVRVGCCRMSRSAFIASSSIMRGRGQ